MPQQVNIYPDKPMEIGQSYSIANLKWKVVACKWVAELKKYCVVLERGKVPGAVKNSLF